MEKDFQGYDHDHNDEVVVFAKTTFRNELKNFGIKTPDRRQHMYVIGKTGVGKSTMLESMVLHDMNAGHGLALVDPHGETVEKMVDFVPPERINDVVYFNPADTEYPMAFNILEQVADEHKHLVASGLMAVFTKIWAGVWSARMEYILNNCVLALLDSPGNTLLGILRMLVDKKFRKKIVDNIKDPVVKGFWVNEYANYNERFRGEAIAPIQNKVGQFLSTPLIRNIVGQPKSTIDMRDIMDNKKIFLLNLSKGRIGEDNSDLLGAMMINKIQLAAMSRVDIPEAERNDFYLYVDEFQNYSTPAFANILSEARKYRLNLIMAHQYIEQMDEEVKAAVFGNVGTMISFRIGATDAYELEKEFTPVFTESDLVNLAKYNIYLKLMIDGVASTPFSAQTLGPVENPPGTFEKCVKVSRERYSRPREEVEEKISRWSGVDEPQQQQEKKDQKKDQNKDRSNKKQEKKEEKDEVQKGKERKPNFIQQGQREKGGQRDKKKEERKDDQSSSKKRRRRKKKKPAQQNQQQSQNQQKKDNKNQSGNRNQKKDQGGQKKPDQKNQGQKKTPKQQQGGRPQSNKKQGKQSLKPGDKVKLD